MTNTTGSIFNIQHFSVHDGPGIRTAVFLKGCPLRCKWCANPESQKSEKELAWTAKECIGCKSCTEEIKCANCRFGGTGLEWSVVSALSADEVKRACPTNALHVIGEEITVGEVIRAVERDMVFYGKSEGGLTVSGGEPLMQPEFTAALIDEAHSRGISCAIETSSFAAWEKVREIAGRIDWYITDIKCIDEKKHIENTGVSNKPILENISRLAKEFPKLYIHLRTPVIPNFNDSENDIAAIAEFIGSLNGGDVGDNIKWELLKYHRLGLPKYESLRRNYALGEAELSQERFDSLREKAKLLFKNTI
jgi:pyruvate formate lyase activating enzyme